MFKDVLPRALAKILAHAIVIRELQNGPYQCLCIFGLDHKPRLRCFEKRARLAIHTQNDRTRA